MFVRKLTLLLILAAAHCMSARAQVAVDVGANDVTVEGFSNVTSGGLSRDLKCGDCDERARIDAAVRILATHSFENQTRLGARVVLEDSSTEDFETGEATLIYFNRLGRFEIGDRMGLPDVLLGYAPNNFTFTGAEYGPASGPSLDPGGGLATAFFKRELAEQVNPLSVLGFTASLAEDQSAKLIFVPQKRNGYLAGLSFAPNATDRRFGALAQAGLTREWYWSQNVLRLGGSYSYAAAESQATRDLHSVNVGVTTTLNDSLMLGIAATYNGSTGVRHGALSGVSEAVGITASLNYNTGPWTIGGFIQAAQAEGDADRRGNDRLRAIEVGASYRLHTRVRLFAAVYVFEFENEGGAVADGDRSGAVLLMGTRLTL